MKDVKEIKKTLEKHREELRKKYEVVILGTFWLVCR